MNLLMLFSAVDFRKIQSCKYECRLVKAVIGALIKNSTSIKLQIVFFLSSP